MNLLDLMLHLKYPLSLLVEEFQHRNLGLVVEPKIFNF